jgi:hypothetical protein
LQSVTDEKIPTNVCCPICGSALVGAVWQIQDNIAVDFAVRGARVNNHTAGEIRTGVTFAFGVTKGPDLLSRLFSMAPQRNN